MLCKSMPSLRPTQNTTSKLTRAINVSGIFDPFVELVKRETYNFDKQVNTGKRQWPKSTQISNQTANAMSSACRESISKTDESKKEALQYAVSSYRNREFPILLLTGLPIAPVKLPYDFDTNNNDVYNNPDIRTNCNVFTAIALGVLGLEFLHKEDSRRVRGVSPNFNSTPASFDTTDELKWHSDSFTSPIPKTIADHTALLCINGDEKISTKFLDGKDIFDKVDDKYKEALLGNNFYCRQETDFVQIDSDPFAIFTKQANGVIDIRYGELRKIHCKNYADIMALDHLKQVITNIKNTETDITFTNGDLCVFDNKRLIHSRTITPKESEKGDFRRLLLRTDLANPGRS